MAADNNITPAGQVNSLANLDDAQTAAVVTVSTNESTDSPLRGAVAQALANQTIIMAAYTTERQAAQDTFDAAVGAINVNYANALVAAAQAVSDAQTALDQQTATETAVDIQAASDAGILPPNIPLPASTVSPAQPAQKVG
jgi:P2-related tail formation protein